MGPARPHPQPSRRSLARPPGKDFGEDSLYEDGEAGPTSLSLHCGWRNRRSLRGFGRRGLNAHQSSSLEHAVTQDEKVRSTAWAHVARGRGNFEAIKDELLEVNRDRRHRRIADRRTGFTGRAKPRSASSYSRASSSQNYLQNRTSCRRRLGSYQWSQKRRVNGRTESKPATSAPFES